MMSLVLVITLCSPLPISAKTECDQSAAESWNYDRGDTDQRDAAMAQCREELDVYFRHLDRVGITPMGIGCVETDLSAVPD